jgi:type III pantothenate kinase
MVLTVDAGNTNIALGLFDGTELRHHWRLASGTQRTSDEVLLHLRELLDFNGIERSQVEGVVISSVVPALTRALHDGVALLLATEPIVVGTHLNLPVTIATDSPSEMGSDLLANAVAGYLLSEGAAIVIDFGTALTFTAIDAGGTVRGAAIAPGLSTAVEGLVQQTAALPMIQLEAPESFLGRNTTQALRSGIVQGYACLVDGMAKGIAAELAPDVPTVIATGGDAQMVASLASNVDRIEPWLTLRGIYEIGIRNM